MPHNWGMGMWRDFDEMTEDPRGLWLACECLCRLLSVASAAGIPDSVVEPLTEVLTECVAQVQPHCGHPGCDSTDSERWEAGALVCRHTIETRQDANQFIRGWLLWEAERAEDTAARLREG